MFRDFLACVTCSVSPPLVRESLAHYPAFALSTIWSLFVKKGAYALECRPITGKGIRGKRMLKNKGSVLAAILAMFLGTAGFARADQDKTDVVERLQSAAQVLH